MPSISYKTANFASRLGAPSAGSMPISLAELVHAAVTVGVPPLSMGGLARPLLEVSWRAAMAAANLSADDSGRWVKTAAYQRLDGSEKSAVSYFLGMTQAKITCARLLRAPHLIHLDAYLAMIGKPTRRSRPDLVGVNFPSMDCTIAVEAKGLSGQRTGKVTREAKKQATSLPGVKGTSEAIRVASVAFFDRHGHWGAYLEDPPASLNPLAWLSVGTVLTTYYRPLVSSVLEAGARVGDDSDMTMARLPSIDLILGIPTGIMTVMSELPTTGPIALEQMVTTGAALQKMVQGRGSVALSPQRDEKDEETSEESLRTRSHEGLDGVYLELGSTWQ